MAEKKEELNLPTLAEWMRSKPSAIAEREAFTNEFIDGFGPGQAEFWIPEYRERVLEKIKEIQAQQKELELMKANLAKLEDIAYGEVRSKYLLPEDKPETEPEESKSPGSPEATLPTEPPPLAIPNIDEYQPDWNWKEKVIYAIKKLERPLKSKEIAAFLVELEPSLTTESANVWNLVSKTASVMAQHGQLHKFRFPGAKKDFYAHPLMLDKSGEIKTEYLWKIPNA